MSMRYPGGLIATSPVNAAYPSGVWTQAQAIPYQSQNVWTRDQYWPYTTLLLQGNGTNGAQNNTFLDSSTNNFTITRNGNTTQGSFTPYEANGYWSAFFAGGASGGYITSSTSADYTFGTGDFTIEGFVFVTGTGTGIFQQGTSNFPTSTTNTVALGTNGGTPTWQMYAKNASTNSTANWSPNTWYHFAVVRSGTTTTLYINGTSVITVTGDSTNYTGTNFGIGSIYGTGSSERFTGYLSNLRVVKGAAVYTANFTPPTSPMTSFGSGTTALIALQSNRYIDTSASPKTLTATDNPSVQAFQPFPGQTTYSTSVLGGSGYFDGSGDFLATPSNAAFTLGSSGDFTVECWMYPIGTQSLYSTVVSTYTDFNSGGGYLNKWHLGYSTTTTLTWYDSAGNAGVSSTNHPINSWSHVAVVRSGSTITMYVNGASIGTQTTNQSYTSQSPVQVGFVTNAAYFNGYISNVRVVKGSAVYTSAFTPPTAPLTAIANTSLLLSTTNAGIFDAAAMNDLETVGNAQVSTSVVKYGTGSMAFDGSGDYCFFPANPLYAFNTGDFTVEMWVYFNALASNQTVAGTASTYLSGGWQLIQLASTTLSFLIESNPQKSVATGTLSTGQWYHIAATRSGTTLRIFVNGVLAASATSSENITDNAGNKFVVGNTVELGAGRYLNGYIDDLRITKGAARYIANFTPPPARMPGQ